MSMCDHCVLVCRLVLNTEELSIYYCDMEVYGRVNRTFVLRGVMYPEGLEMSYRALRLMNLPEEAMKKVEEFQVLKTLSE